MTIDRSETRPGHRLLWPLTVVLLAGCSTAPEETYPVQGLVTLDGKPLEGGGVQFELIEPAASGKRYTARGTVDLQGHYRLSTFGKYDGAVAGRHRVVVFPDQSGLTDDPGAPVPVTVPVKYSAPETTDLEYEVTPGENEINVDLHRDVTSE